MKRLLNSKQKKAYKVLLEILQNQGTRYVFTQGKESIWFTINEIEEAPYYQIKYKKDSYIKVVLKKYKNGYMEFQLKLHANLCKSGLISQEENDYFFQKEFILSTFIMNSLNEMYHKKDCGESCYISLTDDGTPLYDFKKEFMCGLKPIKNKKEPMKTIEQHKKEWFEINAPLGKRLGYPDCCIKEFCDQPPAVLNQNKKASKDDLMRHESGCIKGEFTGFIPCISHAKQINDDKITLGSLIKNRDSKLPKFPLV